MDFYEAGLAAYAKEREQWAGHLGEVSAEDRANLREFMIVGKARDEHGDLPADRAYPRRLAGHDEPEKERAEKPAGAYGEHAIVTAESGASTTSDLAGIKTDDGAFVDP